MQSKLQKILKLKYNPVAIIWSDEKPDGAMQFAKNRWGCVMTMFSQAGKGKTAVFDRDTIGCSGARIGLGFGNAHFVNYPGGVECFYRFLSTGNSDWEAGNKAFENAQGTFRKEAIDNFLHGERYIKTPDLTKKRFEAMPVVDINEQYIIFKPFKDIEDGKEVPQVIIFTVNPDQLSALVILANYARDTAENVIAPFGAGCHTIGILPYREAKSDRPRAIIGLTDISARVQTMNLLGREYLTFAVPYKMFQELESNIEGSFFDRPTWHELMGD